MISGPAASIVPPVAVLVFVAIMAIESEDTFLRRTEFFLKRREYNIHLW